MLGAVFGVNAVIKNVNDILFWYKTGYVSRITRGLIGFIVNYSIICESNSFLFESLPANYMFDSLLFIISGFICYGLLALVLEKIGLTNREKDKNFEKFYPKEPSNYKELANKIITFPSEFENYS